MIITKISDNEIEKTEEIKTKIYKENLLRNKSLLERQLKEIDNLLKEF